MAAVCDFIKGFLHYSSVRYVFVKDLRLGALFRTLQLGVILYVVVYSIVLQRSYVEYDNVSGASTIKVKGAGYQYYASSDTTRVFDAQDLVIPPTMQDAFFVTSRVEAVNQTRDLLCSVSADNKTSGPECQSDANCSALPKVNYSYAGPLTGLCVLPRTPDGEKHCQMQAWCPLENDPEATNDTLVRGVETFSVFIRTNVEFPKFGVTLSNAEGRSLTPNLNLWTVADIIERGCDLNRGVCEPRNSIYERGAIFLAKAEYACDVSYVTGKAKGCQPTWAFSRIDKTETDQILSTGFNFRTVQYADASENERLLKKLYGVRVVVSIYGTANRFGFVPLLISLGAGLGLLGIASLVTDFVLQQCWPNRKMVMNKRFSTVNLDSPGRKGSGVTESTMDSEAPYVSGPYPDEKQHPLGPVNVRAPTAAEIGAAESGQATTARRKATPSDASVEL